MAIIKIGAVDRGCDRVNYIETFIDDVKHWPTSGDFLYPCTTTHLAFIESAYINRFKLSGNTIYLNNSLYWQDSQPSQRYDCVTNVCTPSPTGQFTESTCGGNCQAAPPKSNTLLILAGLAVAAAGIAYLYSQQKKKKEE